jgi:hypothetical protein
MNIITSTPVLQIGTCKVSELDADESSILIFLYETYVNFGGASICWIMDLTDHELQWL